MAANHITDSLAEGIPDEGRLPIAELVRLDTGESRMVVHPVSRDFVSVTRRSPRWWVVQKVGALGDVWVIPGDPSRCERDWVAVYFSTVDEPQRFIDTRDPGAALSWAVDRASGLI